MSLGDSVHLNSPKATEIFVMFMVAKKVTQQQNTLWYVTVLVKAIEKGCFRH